MAEKGRYTKFSNKIGLFSNSKGSFVKNDTSVVLNFPFKDAVLEGGMSKEEVGREERFLHLELDSKDIDTLEEPKVLTDFRYVDEDGEKALTASSDIEFFDADGNLKQNLLIKGNNLLALYTLRERLAGQVKLIYIDPPYNTGNDGFRYNDSFNHSAWLSFMKNRLEVACELLADDGSIFISIDNNEVAYLQVLADEVFGKQNRKNTITVKRGSVTGAKVINPGLVNVTEFVLIYTKNSDSWKPNRLLRKKSRDDRYGTYIANIEDHYSKWRFIPLLEAFANSLGVSKSELKKTLQEEFETKLGEFILDDPRRVIRFASLDEKSISKKAVELKKESVQNPGVTFYMEREGKRPYYVHNGNIILFATDRLSNIDGEMTFSEPLSDIWDDVLPNDLHNEGGVEFRKGKKPEKLIQRLIGLCSDEGDIVLDYHLGSGTTAAVAHKMNRRWIGIEQMDYIADVTSKRLAKVLAGDQGGISKAVGWDGGGSFVYLELKKYNQEYIDRIMEATSLSELEDLYVDMRNNAFLKFWFDRHAFEKDEDFRKLDLDGRKEALADVLDENQLYLNYADMDDTRHKVTADEKTLTDKFYGSNKN